MTLECRHIVYQNIAVDVCYYHIKLLIHYVKHRRITKHHIQIAHSIDRGIMLSIFRTPFVNVISQHLGGTQLGGCNSKNTSSTTAIEHRLSIEVHAEQTTQYHACSLMSTGAKSVARFNKDAHHTIITRKHTHVCMFGIIYNKVVANAYWLEALFFPTLIPILIGHFFHIICHRRTLWHIVGNGIIERLLIIQRTLHITQQSVVSIFKSLKASLAGSSRQQFTGRLHKLSLTFYLEISYKILHFSVTVNYSYTSSIPYSMSSSALCEQPSKPSGKSNLALGSYGRVLSRYTFFMK